MSFNKNAQTGPGLSALEVRHPAGCDLFFGGNEASDRRIDIPGKGPIGNAICWLNCYHSFPQKVFVGRKLIRCFSLVNTFDKNNHVPSSRRNDFVLVQKTICRHSNLPNSATGKIKRSNYAAFSATCFSPMQKPSCACIKMFCRNMPNPG